MAEREELLRQEVVHYKSNRNSTAVLIKQDFTITAVLWTSVLLLLGAVLVLCFIRYKETETVRGSLQPLAGTQQIVAPRSAVVVNINVELQQKVEAGEDIATMTIATYDGEGSFIQDSQIGSLVSEHEYLEQEITLHNALRDQILVKSLDEKANWEINVQQAQQELAVIDQQILISTNTINALEQLLESSSISKAQFDQKQLAHLVLVRQRHEVLQRIEQFRQRLQSHATNHSAISLNQEIAELKLQREKNRFEKEIESIDNSKFISVVAPQAGTIALISSESGKAGNVNEPLMYLNPQDTSLEAILYVPSRAVGKIAPGQNVLLKYDAFDHLQYGTYEATVSEISQASVDPRQHLLPITGLQEPVYKVTALLAQEFVEGPDIFPLQPGLMLSADFVINDMSMLAYIFSPLLELEGKVR